MRFRVSAWLSVLLLLAACTRRALPPKPLAPRLATYRAISTAASTIPTQVSPVVAATTTVPLLSAEQTRTRYEQAYLDLAKMLDGRQPLSFKQAVFLTENAYLNDSLSYTRFVGALYSLARICRAVERQLDSQLRYDLPDRPAVLHNAALFRVLTDSTHFASGAVLPPFAYDFNDFNGEQDWRQMFVSKLLVTHKGNCHSLPFLYQLLASEIGAPSWLALAPNHIYLKQYSQKNGWYNTELTSRSFPTDAWLTASGYISKETIVNGLYLDTLTAKQNVVLCLIDLAKGYQRKAGPDASEDFSLRCATLALQYFPQYINAQLLRAETLRHRFERQQASPIAQQAFTEMEAAYTQIAETGYREIPPHLYAEWLRLAQQKQSQY